MSDEKTEEMNTLIDRGYHRLALETERQKGGIVAQKVMAKGVLEDGFITNEELRKEIRQWLIEQGEDADEVEKLGKEEEVEHKDEESGLETTEDYDWTSTSTLE
jgi:hypothetical protein